MKSLKLNVVLAFIILLIGSLLFMPSDNVFVKTDNPKVGELSKRTVIAPITFDVIKSDIELEQERVHARSRVLATFDYDLDITNQVINKFDSVMVKIKSYNDLQKQISRGLDKENLMSQEAQRVFHELSLVLSTTAIKELANNQPASDYLSKQFHKMQKDGISNVFVASNKKQIDLFKQTTQLTSANSLLYNQSSVKLIKSGHSSIQAVSILMTKENAVDKTFPFLQLKYPGRQALQSAFYEMLYGFSQPNIIYLKRLTKKDRDDAAASINSSKGKVFKGMDIIRKGDLVSDDAIEKLLAMDNALSSGKVESFIDLPLVGRNVVISLLVLFFVIFYSAFGISDYQKIKLNEIWVVVTIMILQFLGFFLFDKIGNSFLANPNAEIFGKIDVRWLYPFLIAPTLSTMLLGIRSGMTISLFTVTYMGIMTEFDLVTTMSAFAVSSITIFFLKDLKSRKEFTSAAMVAVVSFLLVFIIEAALRNQFKK